MGDRGAVDPAGGVEIDDMGGALLAGDNVAIYTDDGAGCVEDEVENIGGIVEFTDSVVESGGNVCS